MKIRANAKKSIKAESYKRYSDAVPYEKRKYWYFTTHGLGPGMIPKGVHVLDTQEGQNKKGTWGDFILLDAVLNTDELKQYDLIELSPDMVDAACGKKSVKASNRPAPRKRAIKASENIPVVMYFNGKQVFEGDITDIYGTIVDLCQDEATNQFFMNYLNQFGDPFDFDGTPEDTAYTFAWWVGQDYDEAMFDERDFYVEYGEDGIQMELFPKSEEVTSSISRRRSNMKITANKRRAIKASYGGWGKFYGLNDVEFTVPNDTDDPTIYYNGKYYNYYAVEDTLWDYYKDECNENGVIPDEADFENWVSTNSYYVYDILDELSPKSEPGRGVYRDEPNTLRRSVKSSISRRTPARAITAAEGVGGKIIVKYEAYVDVTEDDYEQGAVGPYVNSWDFDVRGEYNSAEELIKAIANNSYIFSDKLEDYYFMDGSIRTSAEVDVDNDIPSESQYEAWKRGEEKLYIADMYLAVEVGSVHEMTDDEAQAYGFQLY